MTYRYVREGMLRIAQLYLFCAAAARGTDYFARWAQNEESAPSNWSLQLIQAAGPLWLWGSLLLLCAVTGVVGELWISGARHYQWDTELHSQRVIYDRTLPVYLAHALGASLYATLALAALPLAVHQGWGWTAPVEAAGYALGHLVFMRRDRTKVTL